MHETAPRSREGIALDCGDGVPINRSVARLAALARACQRSACVSCGVDPGRCIAPLPRSPQWLDGSAFQSHGDLMATVFGTERHAYDERPLMYQGLSDRFLPATADPAYRKSALASSFVAALELGNRKRTQDVLAREKISGSRDVFELFQPELHALDRELLVIDQDGADGHACNCLCSRVSNGISIITL